MAGTAVASVRSGIPSALKTIFPGCVTKKWQPVERDLRGHVKEAVTFIEQWLASGKTDKPLRFTDVAKAAVVLGDSARDLRAGGHQLCCLSRDDCARGKPHDAIARSTDALGRE